MKTIKHTVISLSILLALSACRKEVKEPQKVPAKQEYIYVQIDDSKFLVNDKRINLNKNSRGNISENITIWDLECSYSNNFINTDLKDQFFRGYVQMAFPNKTGVVAPRYLRLSVRAKPKGGKTSYLFSGSLENYGNPIGFKDYTFTVLKIDSETSELEYKLECQAFDMVDSTYHKLYIKSKTHYK